MIIKPMIHVLYVLFICLLAVKLCAWPAWLGFGWVFSPLAAVVLLIVGIAADIIWDGALKDLSAYYERKGKR